MLVTMHPIKCLVHSSITRDVHLSSASTSHSERYSLQLPKLDNDSSLKYSSITSSNDASSMYACMCRSWVGIMNKAIGEFPHIEYPLKAEALLPGDQFEELG